MQEVALNFQRTLDSPHFLAPLTALPETRLASPSPSQEPAVFKASSDEKPHQFGPDPLVSAHRPTSPSKTEFFWNPDV